MKEDKFMPQIHLIDGEKGGVGKSFFARALVYYLNLKKLSFHLVDSDRSNPDVASRYPDQLTNSILQRS
jgi:MinD superfamily P-loop ATPase